MGDRLLVSTAPGSDGIVRRIEVRAKEAGTRPNWIVFALTNDTDEQIERLIVAPHFRLVGSGVIWPDLGADAHLRHYRQPGLPAGACRERRRRRVPADARSRHDRHLCRRTAHAEAAAAASLGARRLQGPAPPACRSTRASSSASPACWRCFSPLSSSSRARSSFRPRRRWPGRCSPMSASISASGARFSAPRASPTASGARAPRPILAATLLVFLFAYLNLNRWHVRASHVAAIWLIFLAALVGLSVYDAPVAAGVARISLATIGAVGFILVLYLAIHGYDRAVMLIPTWFLLLAWIIGAGLHRHRHADQRSRLAGADRRPRADRHADRLHHHAERFRRRRPDAWRGLRRRAQGAGADRQRRHHLRLGRRRRPRLRQSRGRGAARPAARRARRAGLELARRAASATSATATAPVSTPCSSRGAAASTRTSGCAPPTASISGIA